MKENKSIYWFNHQRVVPLLKYVAVNQHYGIEHGTYRAPDGAGMEKFNRFMALNDMSLTLAYSEDSLTWGIRVWYKNTTTGEYQDIRRQTEPGKPLQPVLEPLLEETCGIMYCEFSSLINAIGMIFTQPDVTWIDLRAVQHGDNTETPEAFTYVVTTRIKASQMRYQTAKSEKSIWYALLNLVTKARSAELKRIAAATEERRRRYREEQFARWQAEHAPEVKS